MVYIHTHGLLGISRMSVLQPGQKATNKTQTKVTLQKQTHQTAGYETDFGFFAESCGEQD